MKGLPDMNDTDTRRQRRSRPTLRTVLAAISLAGCAWAEASTNSLAASAAGEMQTRLEAASARLAGLRKEIADEKIPMNRSLAEAETALGDLRKQYDTVKREADTATLEMSALRNEIKQRETERNYLSSLFAEYARNFETRLHIAELDLYREPIDEVKRVQEILADDPSGAFDTQLRLILMSLARLEEMSGGLAFRGRAAAEDGLVKEGRFLLFGPVAYFVSDDGSLTGPANQRVGSLIPVVEAYADPALADMAQKAVTEGVGSIPFDASLGNARKIEETRETLREHFLKGGPVMWPMLVLMGLAILVALLKWLGLLIVPMPRAKRLAQLLEAVGTKDFDAARQFAKTMRGPAAVMLRAGCDVLGQPTEVIEETMYEKMLAAKFRFNRLLPFIAVTAACAPLLGLLGTVTGIISTFKLMTVFGSGDVKMLSSGISEALITTEFGLYIAIPAVLCHAFLSRRAKGLGDRLEQVAIRFMGEVAKVPEFDETARALPEPAAGDPA